MNYPFIKCLSPQRIKHPTTGEYMVVGCGKCASCLNLRSQQLSLKCKLETKSHRFCYFVTLTYDETFIPIMVPVAIHGTKGMEYYFISICKRLKEDGQCITIKDMHPHQLDELQKKIGTSYGLPYPSVRDAQLFIKRLRKNIYSATNEKIRYFLCGELGPKHLRPHYHLLVWFDNEQTAERLDECINKSWKFGRTDSQAVAKDASSYVANYVNSLGSIPDLYKTGKCKPFCLHSSFLGEKFFTSQNKEIYRLSSAEFIRRSIRINDSVSEFVLWRSIKNCFYPKCRGYATSSTSERKFLYTLYARFRARKKAHRQPSRLAEEIIREAEELAYKLDIPYDDIKELGQYYDELLKISQNYDTIEAAEISHRNGIIDDDQYLEAYFAYLQNLEYYKNYIYRDLSLSKHFLEFVCNSDNEIEINTKVHMIEYFYMSLELDSLNNQLQHQELMLQNEEDTQMYLQFFYDDYELSDLKKLPLYKVYTKEVLRIRDESQKHKKLNDENRILFNNIGLIQ